MLHISPIVYSGGPRLSESLNFGKSVNSMKRPPPPPSQNGKFGQHNRGGEGEGEECDRAGAPEHSSY